MEQFESELPITLFKDIHAQKICKRIRARVLRIWRPWTYDGTKKDGLHYIMMDAEGEKIHAIISEHYYSEIKYQMEVNHIYDILCFHTTKDKSAIRVVSHKTQLILTKSTKVYVVTQPLPDFAQPSFQYAEFSAFKAMLNQNVLTDVYGCVKSIVKGETYIKQKNRIEPKCDIILQNLRREDLRLTIWGKEAASFDVTPFAASNTPALAMFTSIKSGEYKDERVGTTNSHTCVLIDPPVREAELYKLEFSKIGDKVKLTVPTAITDEAAVKTVQELYVLDEKDYRNKIVHCSAFVDRISLTDSWYYIACASKGCYKDVSAQVHGNEYRCPIHGLQPLNPCYRINIGIIDSTGETIVMLFGEQAEHVLGRRCCDLVDEVGLSNKTTLPDTLQQMINKEYNFSLTTRFTNTRVTHYVQGMQLLTTGKEPIVEASYESSTPEKSNPAKRVAKPLFTSPEKRQMRQSEGIIGEKDKRT